MWWSRMQAAEKGAWCSLPEDALSREQGSPAGREAGRGAGMLPTRESPSREGEGSSGSKSTFWKPIFLLLWSTETQTLQERCSKETEVLKILKLKAMGVHCLRSGALERQVLFSKPGLVFCWKPAHTDYTGISENVVLTALPVGIHTPWLCGVTTAFLELFVVKGEEAHTLIEYIF